MSDSVLLKTLYDDNVDDDGDGGDGDDGGDGGDGDGGDDDDDKMMTMNLSKRNIKTALKYAIMTCLFVKNFYEIPNLFIS